MMVVVVQMLYAGCWMLGRQTPEWASELAGGARPGADGCRNVLTVAAVVARVFQYFKRLDTVPDHNTSPSWSSGGRPTTSTTGTRGGEEEDGYRICGERWGCTCAYIHDLSVLRW